MVRKNKSTGEIDWDSYWAQQIFRSQAGGKDYIFALVKRKYGDRDIESQGPGEYIGISSEPYYEMTTDNDPDSETYGKRIPKEITVYDQSGREVKQKVQQGIDWKPVHEATPENLKNYRKLVGNMPKPHGDTQFYWLLKEERTQANDVNEFFDTPISRVHDILVKNKSSVLKKREKQIKSGQIEEEE